MATLSIASILYNKKPMISKFPYGGVPTLMGLLTKLSLSVYNFNIINNICSRKRNEDMRTLVLIGIT